MEDEILSRVKTVKKKYESQWLHIQGVESIGIGTIADGVVGILVGVSTDETSLRHVIPEKVEGIDVKLFFCGPIEAC